MRLLNVFLLAIMLFAIVFELSTPHFVLAFEKLNIMTEEYPPFNFKKDGSLQGIAVDLMFSMLKKSNYDILYKYLSKSSD